MGFFSRGKQDQDGMSGRDRLRQATGAASASGDSDNDSADARLATALKEATVRLQRLPTRVRAAAYRFSNGELEIAVVIAGDEGLYESLDRLGSPQAVRAILDDCFGVVGAPITAAYNNDRTWADWLSKGGGWQSVQQDLTPDPGAVRTARPHNAEAYGASTDLPPGSHFYVAQQALMYGATPEDAAENYRAWKAEKSWVMHTYQVVNSIGEAYWWNSGSWSEEWLLVQPEGNGYVVTWDTVVPCVPDDPNATLRAAGEQLERQAQAGELDVLVMGADGSRSRITAQLPA